MNHTPVQHAINLTHNYTNMCSFNVAHFSLEGVLSELEGVLTPKTLKFKGVLTPVFVQKQHCNTPQKNI